MIISRDGVEYGQCELCERYTTQKNADESGWVYFIGSLDRSYHYCHQHKLSAHQLKHMRLSEISAKERKRKEKLAMQRNLATRSQELGK